MTDRSGRRKMADIAESARTSTHNAVHGFDESRLVSAAASGNELAREQLIEAFGPRVRSIARLYRGSPVVTEEELMQEGALGLLRALERFSDKNGAPFWAYASWWVRQAMQSLVAELTHPVVLSDRAFRQLARIRQAQREHLQAHRTQPTVADLAQATGLAKGHIQRLWAAERRPRSLAEPVVEDAASHSVIGDQIPDPRSGDDYDRVESRQRRETVRFLGKGLTDRERQILRARYGLMGAEQTLQQVADRVGVTPERVRQIQNRALDKLRAEVHAPLQRTA
jgi:RNA polymerase sigma factor (sigma-70 family)